MFENGKCHNNVLCVNNGVWRSTAGVRVVREMAESGPRSGGGHSRCSRPPRVAFGHSLAIFRAWARQALRHYPKPRFPCLPAASFAVVLPSSWQLWITSCPKPILPLQSLRWRLSLQSFTTSNNYRLQA